MRTALLTLLATACTLGVAKPVSLAIDLEARQSPSCMWYCKIDTNVELWNGSIVHLDDSPGCSDCTSAGHTCTGKAVTDVNLFGLGEVKLQYWVRCAPRLGIHQI